MAQASSAAAAGGEDKGVAGWTPEQCAEWVESIDLAMYRATFLKNLNGYRLQRLSTRGLTQMGVQKWEHQKAIMAALREQQLLLPEFDGR